MDDPTSYKEAMKNKNSVKWCEGIEEELNSMSFIDVLDLVESPDGEKWVYKTKYDFNAKIKRFEARLVTKGFTQREGIDYIKISSLIFKKDSFRIVMTLVAHYNLELHQMDVKIVFLNDDL
jgi:hypothetical protein